MLRVYSLLCLLVAADAEIEHAATGLQAHDAAEPTVLITGATGRTGSILYGMLKERNVTVRALVRNTTKAREVLKCDKCDASEGIFVGDVREEHCLDEAAKGITMFVNLVSAFSYCPKYICQYDELIFDEGEYPKQVEWEGGLNSLRSVINANGDRLPHVVFLSLSGTTRPKNGVDLVGDGWVSHYKLNLEASLLASGLPWTIVKSCRLGEGPGGDGPGGERQLYVDPSPLDPSVGADMMVNADAARVLLEVVLQPDLALNLRFQLCSREGPPTTDFAELLRSGRLTF